MLGPYAVRACRSLGGTEDGLETRESRLTGLYKHSTRGHDAVTY